MMSHPQDILGTVPLSVKLFLVAVALKVTVFLSVSSAREVWSGPLPVAAGSNTQPSFVAFRLLWYQSCVNVLVLAS